MHCATRLGQRVMARDFGRQAAEFRVRVAVLNGSTALGMPVTTVVGQVCPGQGAVQSSPDWCNRAALNQHDHPVVQASLLILAMAVMLGTLIGDVLPSAMDPCVRAALT
jgi:hypothetical protein